MFAPQLLKNLTEGLDRIRFFGRDQKLFADAEGRLVHSYCRAIVANNSTESEAIAAQIAEVFDQSSGIRQRIARAMNSDKTGVSTALAKFWVKQWSDGYLEGRLPHVQEISVMSPFMKPRAMKAMVNLLIDTHLSYLAKCAGDSHDINNGLINISMMGISLTVLGEYAAPLAPDFIREYTREKLHQSKINGFTVYSSLGSVSF